MFAGKICGKLVACFLLMFLSCATYGQKLAIITPTENPPSESFSERLNQTLGKSHKIINRDLAKAVFQSVAFENPYNLTTEEARNFGNAVGCEYFLLLKAENLRRQSLSKPFYYEAYATAFLVSTRTGRLVLWSLKNAEADSAEEAQAKLSENFDGLAAEIIEKISIAGKDERAETLPDVKEIPPESDPDSKNFRAPLPYRRLRPVYTPTANLYGVTATIDALVDIDEKGAITRLEIIRWAGYGLDESVSRTIREMQWRAGSYRDKTLPIRVLLRYNFKKVEKDD